MTTVLGVDLGKTGCRMALWPVDAASTDSSVCDATGSGAPGLAEAGGVQAAVDAIAAVFATLSHRGDPARVCVGAAGVSAAPEAARALATALQATWRTAEIVVVSDAITSHAGALVGRPGVVLAAGTGAVAVGVAADGRMHQVDGWGPWLGDDGSGAWLGRAGLHAALVAYDGRGPATALTAAVRDRFGDDLRALPVVIGADAQPVRALAAFAPAVALAAADGDAVALGLLDRAADALCASILAAAAVIGDAPVPVALTGGLLNLGVPLLGPLTERLRAAADVVTLVPAAGDSLDGARMLAEIPDTVHENALVRVAPRCTA